MQSPARHRRVVIDFLPSSAERYRAPDRAIVGVDVIRATTTATTALALGRTVYLARSADEASELAARLDTPLLVGELGGNVPYGFDLTNSPVQVAALSHVPCGQYTASERPLILVSSSGIPLLLNAHGSGPVFAGCLRNLTALASYLTERFDDVAVLGAGTRGEFREEDQIGCALIAARLLDDGFSPADQATSDLIEKWRSPDLDVIREGKSARYLKMSGYTHDLEFVLSHVDDLDVVPRVEHARLVDARRADQWTVPMIPRLLRRAGLDRQAPTERAS
jgi:2-phosphosulfolactate phosphatase